jgi:hypothetical protein
MSTDTAVLQNPKSHPDNANLPNVNRPETILGVTIAFLVCAIIEESNALDVFVLNMSGTCHVHVDFTIMLSYQETSLWMG